MTGRSPDTNLKIYDTLQVAEYYAALDYLTPCERLLFETYIAPGSTILDLGVGGGRTTAYLAERASRYVGVDYAAAMVKACQAKFRGLEFLVADAADLSLFPDTSFDVVVFSFNGIDYVLPDERRRCCLNHIYRILKAGGVVIFSSHNPRSVVIRPSWNRQRLHRVAQRYSADSKVLYSVLWAALTLGRSAIAAGQALGATLMRVLARVPSRTFWRGEGRLMDSAHGGLLTHYGTPQRVLAELAALQFRPERILGDDYPRSSHSCATDWYYYVFTKTLEK